MQLAVVGNEVCALLDIAQPHRSLAGLDDDEKGRHTVTTLGGPQEVATVNESGLYHLIFKSRKPEAQAFRKWVTSEVLPAIRKTGRYTTDAARMFALAELTERAKANNADERTLLRLERCRINMDQGYRSSLPALRFPKGVANRDAIVADPSDLVAQWFAECVVRTLTTWTAASALHRRFVAWCPPDAPVTTMTAFGRKMRTLAPKKSSNGSKYAVGYRGGR